MNQAHPERRSSFYWGFLFLPRAQRQALTDVYGFCRRIDDIVDSGELTPEEARRQLDFWREEIERLYDGNPGQAMTQGLLPHVRQYRLPKQSFLDVIAGCEMDLNKHRYRIFEDLEPYLHGVAVAVGQMCVEIFGHRHTSPADIRAYAKDMGYAFQLTNILRDIGTDLEKGRIYLPLQEIETAGYSIDDLTHRRHTPAFRALMAFQYDRAKNFYAQARGRLHPLDRSSMIAAEVMARVYEGVLDEIKADDYRVFFDRVRLPGWRKAALALKSWADVHGII